MTDTSIAYRIGDMGRTDPRVLIDPAELSRLREADAALRALGAMGRWSAIATGVDNTPWCEILADGWRSHFWPAPTLPAAILAAHAALVASGELPPLDGEGSGDR